MIATLQQRYDLGPRPPRQAAEADGAEASGYAPKAALGQAAFDWDIDQTGFPAAPSGRRCQS
jgi:hypothetical protein